MKTTEQLQELLSVAEKAIARTQWTHDAMSNFQVAFDPTTCAELVREVMRLREENETFRSADYSFLQKVEEQL
jgi:hypothetical protein